MHRLDNNLNDTSSSQRRLLTQDYATPASPQAFSRAETAFKQALNKCKHQVTESDYAFAGRSIRIRIAGMSLANHVLPPFSHLQSTHRSSDAPGLTIDLWDESEAGTPCPAPLPSDTPGLYRTVTASPDGRFISDQDAQTLILLDREAEHMVSSFKSAAQLLMIDRARPVNRLLALWYSDQGIQVIHSGMVSRNGSGILFAGKGGSGKSTSALACVCAGFQYLGDDFMGLQEQSNGSFLGHSLYNSSLLESVHLARFPQLAAHAIHGESPRHTKSLVLVSHVFPQRPDRVARIRAIALPRVVASGRSQFRSASKGEALLTLAPSSLRLQISPGMRRLDELARLVDRIPCYWLELGEALDEIPLCVERLLAEATGQ